MSCRLSGQTVPTACRLPVIAIEGAYGTCVIFERYVRTLTYFILAYDALYEIILTAVHHC